MTFYVLSYSIVCENRFILLLNALFWFKNVSEFPILIAGDELCQNLKVLQASFIIKAFTRLISLLLAQQPFCASTGDYYFGAKHLKHILW
jgi:hypothetical protein